MKLPLDAKIGLINNMVKDLEFYIETGSSWCPSKQYYKVASRDEDLSVERSSRKKAFSNMLSSGLKKVAFDTRRINQETDRNPRRNLQDWHRSEDFIDDESKDKLEVLAKLQLVVDSLKDKFSTQNEWHDSYARVLGDHLSRLEMKRAGDDFVEVFKPHVNYVEQLVYNRYRMSLEDIKEASFDTIKDNLLKKDSQLVQKGKLMSNAQQFIKEDATPSDGSQHVIAELVKMLKKEEQPKDALSSLFSGGTLRSPGEKSVERTITITIRDDVIE